ncbi:MAG: phage tail protein [Taibaiella sp.]|nr:phage tail protein [Taibaiella sp.]
MESFMGVIFPMGFNFAPRYWAFCNGQILSIAQNTALFSLLGTTYGGNGQTTFALPNLQCRMIVGQGTGPGLPTVTPGEAGGKVSATLTVNQMPAHTHTVMVKTNSAATTNDPTNNYFAGGGAQVYDNAQDGTQMNPACVTSGITGSNIPFSVQNPYLGIYYNICMYGVFPSRN